MAKHLTRRPLLTALVPLSALSMAACAADRATSYGAAQTPVAVPSQHLSTALGSRGVGRLGEVIVDDSGRTLYANVGESTSGEGCGAVCRRTWPVLSAPPGSAPMTTGSAQPRLVRAEPLAGGDVVTYAGHTLHLYVGDAGAGGAAGQGVQQVWAVVTVSGRLGVGSP